MLRGRMGTWSDDVMKKTKLSLKVETIRELTIAERDVVAGGGRSNLTCQGGCASVGCKTHHVSEVAHCTIHTL